jgi:hypothetical protein
MMTARLDPAAGFFDEYARFTRAAEHLAHAAADLAHSAGLVGDHRSAVAIHDLQDQLQLTRAQLAASAERAFSFGQNATRRARDTSMRERLDDFACLAPPAGPLSTLSSDTALHPGQTLHTRPGWSRT